MNDKRLTLLVPVVTGLAFFLGMESGGFQLILLKAARDFKLSASMMGVVVASQYSAITLGPLLFGWVADRIGKKTTLLAAMPLFAVGCFGAALSNTAAVFIGAIFIIGIGYSVCECIGSSAVSDSFPGRESRYLNIMQCGFSLGAVLSPLIFSKLISRELVSWHAVFLSAGGGYVLLYPLLIFAHTGKPAVRENEKSVTSGILSPFLLVLVVAMLSYVAMETGAAFFADSLFVTEYSNTELGAYAISGFWFAMTVSRFVFALVKMKPRNMVLLGFAAAFVLFTLMFFCRLQWVAMGIFISLGMVMGPVWPMIIGIGTSSYQTRSGTVASILAAAGGLGGASIPVLIGIAAEQTGFYSVFCLLAAVAALGFLVMWFRGKPRGIRNRQG
jgi:fucose permease